MRSTQAAYKNSAVLYDMRFGQIRYKDMQDVLNACTLKHASQELIVSLMHQMYKYAIKKVRLFKWCLSCATADSALRPLPTLK